MEKSECAKYAPMIQGTTRPGGSVTMIEEACHEILSNQGAKTGNRGQHDDQAGTHLAQHLTSFFAFAGYVIVNWRPSLVQGHRYQRHDHPESIGNGI